MAMGAELVRFNRDVRPILADNCFACHGQDAKHRKAKLRLDQSEGALAERDGVRAIVPGDLAKSEAWARITSKDEDEVMPPPKSHKELTASEKDVLKRWIEQGAEYEGHWSFVAPQKQEVPKIAGGDNPIDAFLQVRRDKEGLRPSPEADRHTLIRRLSLDLTGLPPTIEEVDTFIAEEGPGSYPELVDRLLAKPAFGEHWARMWLDLARYADSSGYADDPARTIWAYRDYVINAFNQNKPYDQFLIEQLAGDELIQSPLSDLQPADVTLLQATGFLRMAPDGTGQAGVDQMVARNQMIADTINIMTTSILGFGNRINVLTKTPTGDIKKIQQAILRIGIDRTGHENMCLSIAQVLDQFTPLARKQKRQLVVIVVSDESPTDHIQIEQAIQRSKKAKSPIYILGREAIFGYPYARLRWKDPVYGLNHWVRIDRGPETAFPECLQYDGMHARWDSFSSGFGPYA